jgi:hypothetical protein
MRPLSIRRRLTIWYSLILLVILVVVGGLSYSVLRTRLLHDVDASLLTVAQAVQGASPSAIDAGPGPLEQWVRDLLGPEVYDKLFQFSDPEGHAAVRSPLPQDNPLPVSAEARRNAAAGQSTFETVDLPRQGPTRSDHSVMPAPAVQLVQVGCRWSARQTLASYSDARADPAGPRRASEAPRSPAPPSAR